MSKILTVIFVLILFVVLLRYIGFVTSNGLGQNDRVEDATETGIVQNLFTPFSIDNIDGASYVPNFSEIYVPGPEFTGNTLPGGSVLSLAGWSEYDGGFADFKVLFPSRDIKKRTVFNSNNRYISFDEFYVNHSGAYYGVIYVKMKRSYARDIDDEFEFLEDLIDDTLLHDSRRDFRSLRETYFDGKEALDFEIDAENGTRISGRAILDNDEAHIVQSHYNPRNSENVSNFNTFFNSFRIE